MDALAAPLTVMLRYLRGKTAHNQLTKLESYWPRWPQPTAAYTQVYGAGNAFAIFKFDSNDGEQWSARRRVKNITTASVAAAVCTGLLGNKYYAKANASFALCVRDVTPLPIVDVGPASGGMVETPGGTLLWFISFSAQMKWTELADRHYSVPECKESKTGCSLGGVNTVVRSTDSGGA